MNEQQFRLKVWQMQGDAIDLAETQYKGEHQPVIVRCSRDGLSFAVERAADLYDDEHPAECPLCRERHEHTMRMNRIRLRENNRLRSALHLISIL